ncbi:MAG: hypothetical protein HON98_07665 [Chloroflexi bacterium]|jgi:hypothetical protein|nr:hypothetical protein [Chloroflexota bacterium]MBT3669821.1 hypothetical protein [Chloroflexota bacterium]MBT4002415.1 hypothetical protein [Chloroflexota bacterium]MBT4304722.1 hypothetical protein [Chloroflexota bacterium]MBT4534776.1 hypothetical protein [Chloroflexota bacterium]
MFRSRNKQKQSFSGKLIGALFGLGMFAGAFFLLWNNEGRINFGDIAQDSITINALESNNAISSELIALEGPLHSPDSLSDPVFIENTDYIQLNRQVEMYAWTEKEVNEDDETYYEYSEEWTTSPDNSSTFVQSGYDNPAMGYENLTFTVPTAFIGNYEIDPNQIEFPDPQSLNLNQEPINNEVLRVNFVSLTNEYIYFGESNLDSPDIGDLRISFTAVPQNNFTTTFGEIKQDQLLPYVFEGDESLFRVFFVDRENAILQMDDEYSAALWGIRFAGFTLLWCGMFLLLNPITIIVAILPALEKAGVWLLIAITFPIAAVISILFVLVSYLAHNPLVLIGFICLSIFAIVAVALVLYLIDKRRDQEIPTESE